MIQIPGFFPGLREPPRPAHLRQPTYADDFDDTTLLYDAIHDPRTCELTLIGPPALNLRAHWKGLQIEYGHLEVHTKPSIKELDRCLRIRVKSVRGSLATVRLLFPSGAITVSPELAETELFDGKKVLITMSRDNPIQWIKDWLVFHINHHGVDSLLLFDNKSTGYTTEEIERSLRPIRGLRTLKIVSWPHTFGPTAMRGTQTWDSDFSKHGFLEVARWKYLRGAKWVLNLDVDELLVHPGGKSLEDFMKSGRTKLFLARGRWAFPSNSPSANLSERRFVDSVLIDSSSWTHTKWALKPDRVHAKQWTTHAVRGVGIVTNRTHGFEIRHFYSLSTSWKYPRDYSQIEGRKLQIDPVLSRYFAK